jgi:membrane protease YdiL (CAAX protease family)
LNSGQKRQKEATLSPFDALLLLVLAVGLPLSDRYLESPLFRRWLRDRPTLARPWSYALTCLRALVLALAALVAWYVAGRSWAALRLTGVHGWRAWTSFGLSALLAILLGRNAHRLARNEARRLRGRHQVEKKLPPLAVAFIPRTPVERAWMIPVALTAGFGEELLYRGYFIAVLAPWLSWWGAAAVSAVSFGLAHNYQGLAGIVRCALLGAALTLVVAVSGSLLPAMVLHATMDLNLLLLSMLFRSPEATSPAPNDDSVLGGITQ